MLIEHQHPLNKSIMMSVIGAPNVGKSSLINYLIGTDLSIVTHKAQTTRNNFHCVFTIDRTEVILVDTPGLHQAGQEINRRMNQQAKESVDGVDVNLLLIDLTKEIMPQFANIEQHLEGKLGRTWVVFTKIDLLTSIEGIDFDLLIEKAKETIPNIERHFFVSSKTGDRVHELTGAICDTAQSGPHLYNKGQISNKHIRFFVAEYVREQLFQLLKDELPYETAVTIEEYKDYRNSEKPSKIAAKIIATIHVNRASQRAIVVGKKGSVIKEIGTRARKKVEDLMGGQVSLNLHAKVSERWFKNNFILEELAYQELKTLEEFGDQSNVS